jgi:hypothetical protein
VMSGGSFMSRVVKVSIDAVSFGVFAWHGNGLST